MTLVEHLTELRRRLIISVVAIFVGALVAYILYPQIFRFLADPYVRATHQKKFLALDPLEGFATRLKVSGYGGVVLALPVLLWQFWRFITPGLNKTEKRYAIPFVAASLLLFAIGAVVAYLVLAPGLQFLSHIGGANLQNTYSPNKYLTLFVLMVIVFGIAFEFPVVLVALEAAGVVSSARLRGWRRQAIVGCVAFAAFITPSQDPFSFFGMAVPMYLFYEISILIGRLMGK
ncbi:MAG: Sec-independent protein translocase TatC [Acidimicrobiales bacterium]|jgi:sec-independent protein translocase protein TatC|nr:Sec-independent protein translocase TatC [Acidimicrobiales bacterium]